MPKSNLARWRFHRRFYPSKSQKSERASPLPPWKGPHTTVWKPQNAIYSTQLLEKVASRKLKTPLGSPGTQRIFARKFFARTKHTSVRSRNDGRTEVCGVRAKICALGWRVLYFALLGLPLATTKNQRQVASDHYKKLAPGRLLMRC